jgi:ribosome-associated protein
MDSEEYRQPSKSALKRAAKEIEEMAGQLAEAADGVVAGLELSEEVREEIELARHTTGRGARKRQVKHLAGLLRHRPEEAAAIQEHLLGQSECHWEQQRVFHQLEEWRDRLCDPDQATATLAELGNRSPGLDFKELARLSRAACQGDKAAARQIFRRLREIADTLA